MREQLETGRTRDSCYKRMLVELMPSGLSVGCFTGLHYSFEVSGCSRECGQPRSYGCQLKGFSGKEGDSSLQQWLNLDYAYTWHFTDAAV